MYLTSNDLPKMAGREDTENYNWPAVRVRTNFYEARESKRGDREFPLDAAMLAHLLMDLSQEEAKAEEPEEVMLASKASDAIPAS